jgi:hypothetical protein
MNLTLSNEKSRGETEAARTLDYVVSIRAAKGKAAQQPEQKLKA